MINDSYQKISDDRQTKCNDSSGMISDSFRRLGFVTSDSFFFLCVGMYAEQINFKIIKKLINIFLYPFLSLSCFHPTTTTTIQSLRKGLASILFNGLDPLKQEGSV